ncbi:hypothetical protein [Aquicella lusitana]|uniref:Uncharacterized protein n=1 Tax=Aquicella lusitana TaxID=254246 RepID=A0A370GQL1_9COXI|nr:hypothetical protein [Aquicella lusitana]RDI46002.1 hypothetical protein C8D86_1066 [Aquicella lusitana]VVC73401.1 hypothetical protein AQULUS_11400 [Aquicella lusitana]
MINRSHPAHPKKSNYIPPLRAKGPVVSDRMVMHLILKEEDKVNHLPNYINFCQDMQKAFDNMLTSLTELGQAADFVNPGNFPVNKQGLLILRDSIRQSIEPLFKVIEIASLVKDTDNHIRLAHHIFSYTQVFNICREQFIHFAMRLVSDKFIPPIVPDKTTQLFWSTDLGQSKANAYALTHDAITDTQALKHFGRIVAGWRPGEMSLTYQNKHGKYLNVFYDMLNLKTKNSPFEDLRTFFWDAYSEVYGSQIRKNSQVKIFFQGSLTQDNFFWRTELPQIRKTESAISAMVATKKLEGAKINLPGSIGQTISDSEVISVSADAASITIFLKGDTQLRLPKKEKNQYLCELSNEKLNLKEIFQLSASECLNLINPSWNAVWAEIEDVDINFTQLRKRLPLYSDKAKAVKVEIPQTGEVSEQLAQVSNAGHDLFIASQRHLKHTWLSAYKAARKKNEVPLFGPKYMIKVFLRKHPDMQPHHIRTLLQQLNEHLHSAWKIVRAEKPGKSDLRLAWDQILIDIKNELRNILVSKIAAGVKLEYIKSLSEKYPFSCRLILTVEKEIHQLLMIQNAWKSRNPAPMAFNLWNSLQQPVLPSSSSLTIGTNNISPKINGTNPSTLKVQL